MITQTIFWDTVNYFTPQEFSEDPNEFAHPELIRRLDFWREEYGYAIEPSKAPGALARTDMGSRTSYHFADPFADIQSRAVDVFPQGSIKRAFLLALMGGFGGVGVYFGKTNNRGEPATMMHVDIRPGPKKVWMWTDEKKYEFYMDRYNGPALSAFWQRLDKEDR